ncbi:hypothetical protein, partial [Acinetobacter baumannii]|uniref:hypothetical protein n=1 Tax=Acinetobacter baumannii TaxID=470 RepID=UPI003EBCD9C9
MGSCAAPSAKGDDKFITTDYLQQCLTPSSCRSGFWSKVLTLIYPMRCPVMEFPAKCQGRLYDLQRDMSINSKFNPILTQFTHGI